MQCILLCLNCMNILGSFCACVHESVCVCLCTCESVMNCLRVHKKKVFEGILLVKTNPPSVKAGYGPASLSFSMFNRCLK